MAGPYYVRSSDGNDGNSGLSWALAKATFGAAVALAAAGERIYVDDDHQEVVTVDTTYTFAGTEGNPVEVIVVETDTTTAVSNYNSTNQWISGIANAAHFVFNGEVYFWGIYFAWGDGTKIMGTSGKTMVFEKSKLLLSFASSRSLLICYDNNTLILINSDIELTGGSVLHQIKLYNVVNFIWVGGSFIGNMNSFMAIEHEGPSVEIIGVDFTDMVGGTLFYVQEGAETLRITMKGILLNATQPDFITAGISPERNSKAFLDIADNGNTVYKFRREYQYGYAQDETTKVITGKALYDGTNEFTVKMVSRATPTPTFYDPWRYHLTTLRETGFAANRTYTVHIAQDHASVQPAALNNDEIWLEVVYPDDSTAKFNIANDKIATPTTTPAAQTTSTESWEGLAATTRLQELAVTIASADGKNGPVEIWVCMAKEDKTIYVCPEVYVS